MNTQKKQFLSIALLLSFPIAYAGDAKVNAKVKESTATTKAVQVKTPEETKEEIKAETTLDPLIERYANAQELMGLSDHGKDLQQEISKKGQELSDSLEKQKKKITDMAQEHKGKADMKILTGSALDASAARLNEEQRGLTLAKENADSTMQVEISKAGESLTTEMRKAAEDIAHENGIDVIKDIVTNQVIYASDKALITDELLTAMNKEYAGKKSKKTKK